MRKIALALAGLCCLVPALAWSAPRQPWLEIKPERIVATPDFKWSFALLMHNPLEVGLYPDSVTATAEELDAGRVDGPRTQAIPLAHVTRFLRPISAGEQQGFNYSGTAYFEHARVTFRFHSHTGDGKRYVAERTVEILPGPSSTQYESRTIEIDGRKVEYVYLKGVRPPNPWPGLLLVHGEQGNARRMLPFGRELALTGYSVMLVSLPGYGGSEGEPDLMGPASESAVERAYQILRGMPDLDTTKISAWGVSLGAGVVARFAARHPELVSVVLQGGLYDLWAVARARGAESAYAQLAGSDSSAWSARSALIAAPRIPSPVLVLHGEQDPAAPIAQARAYVEVLKRSGTKVEIASPAGAAGARPFGQAANVGIDFVERRVGIRKR